MVTNDEREGERCCEATDEVLRQPSVRRLIVAAREISGNVESEEDLRIAILIKALSKWSVIKAARWPKAYLARLVRNCLISLIRTYRRCNCRDEHHQPRCNEWLVGIDWVQAAAEDLGAWAVRPLDPHEIYELREHLESVALSLPVGWKRDALMECMDLTPWSNHGPGSHSDNARAGRPEVPIRAACRDLGIPRRKIDRFVAELRIRFGLTKSPNQVRSRGAVSAKPILDWVAIVPGSDSLVLDRFLPAINAQLGEAARRVDEHQRLKKRAAKKKFTRYMHWWMAA